MKDILKIPSPTTVLKFDKNGDPILPQSLNEFDDATWARVGLKWERATQLEDFLRDHFRLSKTDAELAEKIGLVISIYTDAFKDKVQSETEFDPWQHNSHWASGHFSCHAKRGYDFFGEAPKLQPELENEFTFDIGRWVGVFVAACFAKAGILENYEEYFKDKIDGLIIPRSGKADVKIRDPTNNNKIVPVEVKSTSGKQYEDKEYRTKTVPGKNAMPGKSNVAQLFDYINAHNMNPKNEKIDYGYLFYVSKESSDFAIHKVWWNQTFWEEMTVDDACVEYYVTRDRIPPRHPNAHIELYVRGPRAGSINPSKSKFPCAGEWGRCDYVRHCWSAEIAAQQSLPEEK